MAPEKLPDLCLHKAVFSGDSQLLQELLKKTDEKEINSQDIHGNTALHIAIMKGNKICVEMLIKSGAITTIRNEMNWMSHHEAISYGDIEIIKLLNEALSRRIHRMLKKEFLMELLKDIKEDFIMKFEIRIIDYNPNQANGPPEGKITLAKKGLKLRIDSEFQDYYHSSSLPETFHLIVDLNENSDNIFTLMLGQNVPIYQSFRTEEWAQLLEEIFNNERYEEEISSLMSKENISIKIEKDPNYAERPNFRKAFTKKVGGYKTVIYESQDIDFTTKKRSEHLRAREESNSNTNERIESLPPPTARSDVTWDQYINSPKGMFPYLGRKAIEIIETKRVSIIIGLTDELSVDWQWLINSFSKIFSDRFKEKVLKFMGELPKGFPVLIDYPLKPGLYLKWKCESFQIPADIDDSLFEIPEGIESQQILVIGNPQINND